MPARRYYFTSSASRPLVFEGREYKFVPLSVLGGRVSGLFDTDDETDIAILGRAVARRAGVTEMTEADAIDAKKKAMDRARPFAASSPDALPPRLSKGPVGALLPEPAITGAGSAGSAAKPADRPVVNTEITLPTIISMVKVAAVKPPQPLVPESQRMEIRGKR